MSLIPDLGTFKRELQATNRKLDQVIALLKMLVEAQCNDCEDGDEADGSDTE